MLSILVVDDEPTIRLAIGDALAQSGYGVMRASNGAEALKLCASQPFDVVVTDINMPEMDGMILLRRLRVICPATDVLLMTAFAQVEDVIRAFKLGAEDYVTKPFTNEELLAHIRQIDARRQGHRSVTKSAAR